MHFINFWLLGITISEKIIFKLNKIQQLKTRQIILHHITYIIPEEPHFGIISMSKGGNIEQLAIFCMQISKVQFVDFRGGDQCPAGGGDA